MCAASREKGPFHVSKERCHAPILPRTWKGPLPLPSKRCARIAAAALRLVTFVPRLTSEEMSASSMKKLRVEPIDPQKKLS